MRRPLIGTKLAMSAAMALAVTGAVCTYSSPASALTEAGCVAIGGTVQHLESGVVICVIGALPVGNPGVLPHSVENCFARGKFVLKQKSGSLACAEKFISGDGPGGARK